MKSLGGMLYNISKKVFAERIKEDESLKGSGDSEDIFGSTITAVQLLTYPPVTTGLLVVKPEYIIKRHKNIMQKLCQLSELDEVKHDKTIPTFETLYKDVVINFIKFVHLVPASESHHHTDPGGLLQHSLQVSEKALKHVGQEILKQQFPLDIERTRKARWFYATWVCGLMHDVSKVFTDLKVVDMANGLIWNPNESGIVDWAFKNKVKRYKVEFINGRRLNGHDSIKGSGALDLILTPAAKKYLFESPDNIYEEMRKTMVSYQSIKGYISNAVRAADAASTSKDMITIWDNDLGPKTAALYQRIIKAMRILSKQWDSNTHNAKVQIVSGRVYVRYPEAFQDISKFLTDEGIPAPSSTDALVSVLDDRNLIYRPDNQSKYVMIANGEFTPELIIENIKNESKSIKSGMYLPLEWPAMIYNKDPVPPSVVCYVKINRDHDYEIHKSDGSMEECNFESLCAIDDSIKPLLVTGDDNAGNKLSGGMIPVDKKSMESLQQSSNDIQKDPAPEKNVKSVKKKTVKPTVEKSPIAFQNPPIQAETQSTKNTKSIFSLDQQQKHEPVASSKKIPVISLASPSVSDNFGLNIKQGLFPAEEATPKVSNKNNDEPKEGLKQESLKVNINVAGINQRKKSSSPWAKDGEPPSKVDTEIIVMIKKFKASEFSEIVKSQFYFFDSGYVGVASKIIRDLVDGDKLSASEFILQADNQGYISKSEGQKNAISKFKIGVDKTSVGLIVFNSQISKYIIEQTGMGVDKNLPSLKGR